MEFILTFDLKNICRNLKAIDQNLADHLLLARKVQDLKVHRKRRIDKEAKVNKNKGDEELPLMREKVQEEVPEEILILLQSQLNSL